MFPHLGQKGLIQLIILLILIIGLVVALFLVQHPQIFKPKAAGLPANNLTTSGAIRGQSGDLWADIVLGQPNFGMLTPNEVVPYKTYFTFGGGTVVDRSVSPGRLYVWDGGNSRVLGIDLAKCYNQESPCSADIVIGQPDGYSSACNGDGNAQTLLPGGTAQDTARARGLASPATLCGVDKFQASITENISMSNMYVDSQGNLYVPDHKNHRVLKYTSPFTTDTIADEIWGQDDFTGVLCNKSLELDAGNTTSSASSLCFHYNGGGVTTDSQGNIWIADSGNNRVLRFPPGSKSADLVLGQTDFNTRGMWSGGNTLDKMNDPVGVRFDASGKLYVADSGNGRVLVFTAPFTTGMQASGLLGSNYPLAVQGLEMDPSGAGVWVQDDGGGHSRVVLFDFTDTVKKIIGKDSMTNNGECAGGICNSVGSIGIDTQGNLLLSNGRYFNNVLKFSPPFPDPAPGVFAQPSKHLFSPPSGINKEGSKGLGGALGGITLTSTQLIVNSGGFKFWNNPQALITFQAADGFLQPGTALGATEASNSHLFAIIGYPPYHEIWAYNLPITENSQPTKKIKFPLPILGGGQVSGTDGMVGLEPQEDGKYLWVSQGGEYSNIHRVFRIRDPLTNPIVDVILGQADAAQTGCNRDPSAVTNYLGAYDKKAANTVCFPSIVEGDRLGNIWVSDFSLEAKGNRRILEYNKSIFENITTTALFGPSATKIIPNIESTGLAFDSQNRMVIGNALQGRFYMVFDNPLGSSVTPDRYLNDLYSVGAAAEFDENDNLYTSDHNRARILIYKKPFSGAINRLGSSASPSIYPYPTPAVPSPSPSRAPSLSPSRAPSPSRGPITQGGESTSAKRVFITSTSYNGNLGGLLGADQKCQTRANSANLGGSWKAWLSSSTVGVSSRLGHFDGSYKSLDAAVVANSWSDLTDGKLQKAVNRTETGKTISWSVWTATTTTGNSAGSTNCNNWTSSSSTKTGKTGSSFYNTSRWTSSSSSSCSLTRRLYCIEQ